MPGKARSPRSTAGGWSSSSARAVTRPGWRASPSPRRRRSAAGSAKPAAVGAGLEGQPRSRVLRRGSPPGSAGRGACCDGTRDLLSKGEGDRGRKAARAPNAPVSPAGRGRDGGGAALGLRVDEREACAVLAIPAMARVRGRVEGRPPRLAAEAALCGAGAAGRRAHGAGAGRARRLAGRARRARRGCWPRRDRAVSVMAAGAWRARIARGARDPSARATAGAGPSRRGGIARRALRPSLRPSRRSAASPPRRRAGPGSPTSPSWPVAAASRIWPWCRVPGPAPGPAFATASDRAFGARAAARPACAPAWARSATPATTRCARAPSRRRRASPSPAASAPRPRQRWPPPATSGPRPPPPALRPGMPIARPAQGGPRQHRPVHPSRSTPQTIHPIGAVPAGADITLSRRARNPPRPTQSAGGRLIPRGHDLTQGVLLESAA